MIAAVAGAAGAAVIAQATPAAATDGSAVLAGRANSSNTETYVHSTAKVGLGATTSSSNNATAVYGLASAEAGTNNGVFGQAFGSSSIGVLGVADAGSGASYGVYGRSYSTSGVGVHGHSTAGSGEAIGVSGRTDSTGGTAVHGLAAASSGATIGVYGRSLSAAGFGVFCEGRLKATGRSYLRTPNSAPVDTDLDTGSVSMYLSQATNQLKIRVKFTTGVMRTATIPLA